MENKNIWKQVMALKKADNRHSASETCANNLTMDEIETIVATADFWGEDIRQIIFDLKVARYRIFDWLGMAVMGRIDSESAVKVFAYSFLKSNGDVDKFIAHLRETDYECDTKWEALDLER